MKHTTAKQLVDLPLKKHRLRSSISTLALLSLPIFSAVPLASAAAASGTNETQPLSEMTGRHTITQGDKGGNGGDGTDAGQSGGDVKAKSRSWLPGEEASYSMTDSSITDHSVFTSNIGIELSHDALSYSLNYQLKRHRTSPTTPFMPGSGSRSNDYQGQLRCPFYSSYPHQNR